MKDDMKKKSIYTSPDCLVVSFDDSDTLLADSSILGTAVSDEYAGEDVSGLSRYFNMWDDNEDYEDFFSNQ